MATKAYEITFIDSFYCEPTEKVYGETTSARLRDRTIAWMESVGFKGIDVRSCEVGKMYLGDLDISVRRQKRQMHDCHQ